MKRIAFLLFSWIFLTASTTVQGAGIPSSDDFEIVDGVLVKYNGAGGHVVIPDGVTSIEQKAFYDCHSLTSVEIPNSVTSIGGDAFYGCRNLTSIEIPYSVRSIGLYAFVYCSKLRHVFVNWANPLPTDTYIFSNIYPPNDDYLIRHTLYVPYGTKTAYQLASGWKDFGTIIETNEIPNDFEIVNGVLVKYRGFGDQVVIPDEVTRIGNKAFVNCTFLKSVEIPSSVTNIGDSAFYDCRSLTAVKIPNQVASLGRSVFANCILLKSVEIPSSVTNIGDSAFYGCRSLTSVKIPSHVINIGGSAFYGCRGLTSVEIPNQVASIGRNAFEGCSYLKNVTVHWATPLLIDEDYEVFRGIYSPNILCVPAGTKAAYQSASVWRNFGDVAEEFEIVNGVLVKYHGAGSHVVIPYEVTSIGQSAFSGCSSLTSVEIPYIYDSNV